VPYCVPAWGWAEHWAILKCLLTGKLIDGPDIKKLYDRIREVTGVKYVFGFNSGQEAIQAAFTAGGVGNGDYVIMPSYCCETVAKAIVNSGATPLFCDIGDDLNPDVDHILRLINTSVKAIIFPHLFGNPGAIDRLEKELEKIGQRSRIFLIDDAAQSFGAKLNGRLLGTFGDVGIISFGPGKTMTATGGGLLITSSENLSKKIRQLSVNRPKSRYKFVRIIYWVVFRRWRKFTLPFYRFLKMLFEIIKVDKDSIMRLSNIDAAIAIEQLNKLHCLLHTRIKRKEILDGKLAEYNSPSFFSLSKNHMNNSSQNVATKYLVIFKYESFNPKYANDYNKAMVDSGIEIQALYTPIHMKSGYSYSLITLSKTETLYNRILQIPVEPSINNREFDFVANKFFSFITTTLI
jgi:dTDP-4-amino-4,6-dideoxygalactose transaminase